MMKAMSAQSVGRHQKSETSPIRRETRYAGNEILEELILEAGRRYNTTVSISKGAIRLTKEVSSHMRVRRDAEVTNGSHCFCVCFKSL